MGISGFPRHLQERFGKMVPGPGFPARERDEADWAVQSLRRFPGNILSETAPSGARFWSWIAGQSPADAAIILQEGLAPWFGTLPKEQALDILESLVRGILRHQPRLVGSGLGLRLFPRIAGRLDPNWGDAPLIPFAVARFCPERLPESWENIQGRDGWTPLDEKRAPGVSIPPSSFEGGNPGEEEREP